jgi:hypothetical protein
VVLLNEGNLFIFFNLENDLSPEQLMTIKQKNNLKIVSTFGKAA